MGKSSTLRFAGLGLDPNGKISIVVATQHSALCCRISTRTGWLGVSMLCLVKLPVLQFLISVLLQVEFCE